MAHTLKFVLFILALYLSCTICHCAYDEGDFDVCVSVRQREYTKRNATTLRPGKRGPTGQRGPKGDVGPPGPCVCDDRRQDEQQNEINRLKDLYNELMPSKIYFEYSQNRETCSVGIKSGGLSDSAFSASSSWRSANHGPHLARLDNPNNSPSDQGIWAAGNGQVNEWIQVDLVSPTKITGIITQGRRLYDQWITSFRISYGNDSSSLNFVQNAQETDKIFVGNNNRESYKVNAFIPALTARYFRLYVASYHGYASLRMEYLKC